MKGLIFENSNYVLLLSLFFVNISLFKSFFVALTFLSIFIIANQSPNLKAKYNFKDLFKIEQIINNISDENLINSIINDNRYLFIIKLLQISLNKIYFLEKDLKHTEWKVIMKNISMTL